MRVSAWGALGTLLLFAQDATGAAEDLWAVPQALKVHLRMSEDLDPDLLMGLPRHRIVLWLETRSNLVRRAWIDRLADFSEAYVEWRPPFRPVDLWQLARRPAVRLWLWEGSLQGAASGYRLGARGVAVRVAGRLDEAKVSRIRSLRPVRVEWDPGTDGPTLEEWASFVQIRGAKAVWLPAGEAKDVWLRAWANTASKASGAIRFVADLEELKAGPGGVPLECAVPLRVRVPLSARSGQLAPLFRGSCPVVDLELAVGKDGEALQSAREILERLEGGR